MTATGATARPLRADAVRNRARILEAAAEVFAERGLEVTLDDIAHHAGLGVGTVYRRFSDRESLVEALFDERMQVAKRRMEAALDEPDAMQALEGVIRENCEQFAADRGLRQVMLTSTYGQNSLAQCREEIPPIVERLVQRAKESGALRSDFQATDIPILFLMIGAVVDFTGAIEPGLWRRYLELFLDGIRVCRSSDGGATAPGSTHPALLHDQLMVAMGKCRPVSLR